MKSELLLNVQLIAGTALLLLLAALVFLLIEKVRKRRALAGSVQTCAPAFPFPQSSHPAPAGGHFFPPQEALDATLRDAYSHWLEAFLLPDAEAGRAFVRAGVARHWLRYQLTAGSFTQALGMLLCVLMAGADPLAQTRFDALLAFCLSRPAADHPDLMSWQVMPDVVPGARLNADPRAEAWQAYALLCAAAQWTRSARFDYARLAAQRLDALLELRQALSASAEYARIPARLARLFSRVGAPAWQKAAAEAEKAEVAFWKRHPDFSGMDAQLRIEAAGLGLAQGLCPAGLPAESRELAALPAGFLQEALSEIRESTAEETQSDLPDAETLSAFSLLACYGIAAAGPESSELAREYWEELSGQQAKAGSAVEASLRLLAMAALSGRIWFSEALGAKALPQEQ
ncbi:MAG: hypothetical protein GX415_02995 [Chloroflexi bacterium]|nr:hypothetical protein [Anaerolineaceae bacterium]NLI44366.1 hypothetical protein [Chloroflexota bacterium]HOE34402.1 hypothetical protein [Anaerolineaceae bacterium]HOT25411.1 hypothetical protein [Anaerolineaceae bacterium]HQH57397.1 hypothetical protein [Anaerolineaceae bacterium]